LAAAYIRIESRATSSCVYLDYPWTAAATALHVSPSAAPIAAYTELIQIESA
jgi:hypothetical protein